MLNFVLCDDNVIILNRLSKMLEDIFVKRDLDAKVTYTSTSADDILNYVENNSVDVLILDIGLESNITGIDLAEKIRAKNKHVYIIFSTAHLEYALIAYKLKTFDYLPKPITQERMEETILRIFDDINENTEKHNFISIGNSKTLVKEDDIQYIKKDGTKLVYQTPTSTYQTYSSFSKIEKDLPSNFVRCHKSYIVNIKNIVDIEANSKIKFSSNNYCLIGPKYKKTLMEVFNNGDNSEYMDSIV